MDNRDPLLMDLRARHVQLEARLDRFMVQMDRRFEHLERRFLNVDARIDRVDLKVLKQSLKTIEPQSYGPTAEMPMSFWWLAGLMLAGSIGTAAVILAQ